MMDGHKTMAEIIQLPKHTFVGPNTDPALLAEATEYIENDWRVELPPEVEKTSERLQQLADMNDAFTRFGDELGIDIRARLPTADKIHYLDEHGIQQMREMYNKPDTFLGGANPSGDVVIKTYPDDTSYELSITNHEIAHVLAHRAVRMTGKDGSYRLDTPREGYRVNQSHNLHALNEIVTERVNRTVQEKYWPQYDSLRGFTDSAEGYNESGTMPVGYAMVAKMAKKQEISEGEIWDGLMKGTLTGNMYALEPIADTFGTEGLKTIVKYREITTEKAGEVALRLGLDVEPTKHK